ncbi:MAG: YdbH domain-containing protein [Sphingomonadaceae bacterium]|nr:YdbH domain-containing protein [Sphingomonadaceae bacterium]
MAGTMAEAEVEPSESAAEAAPAPRRRRWRRGVAIVLGLLVVALGLVWWQRENLAHRIIADQLKQYELQGTYRLEQIGPLTQVLSNVVLGDPARPDFTADRVEVTITPTFGLPAIGAVRLVRPRLYGSYRDGTLTFGSLDKALFAPGAAPPGLPDLDLQLEDARALIDTDFGPLGLKAAGRGNLRDGFIGQLAVAGPALRAGECRIDRASAFGAVTTADGKPRFKGPLRLAALACPGLKLGATALAVDLTADAAFASARGTGKLAGGPLDLSGQQVARLGGELDLTWRKAGLIARYRLTANGLTGEVAARDLAIEGVARGGAGLGRLEGEGTLTGQAIRPGAAFDRTLAGLERAAAGTLGAPLLAQLRAGLQREGANSRLEASYTLRRSGALTSLIVPTAELTGSSGQSLLVLSRGQLALGGAAGLRLSGNVRTGGAGLPRLSGQVERQPGGAIAARLAMPEYRARDAALALPQLVIVRRADGAIGLSGKARLSGAFPGGRVSDLAVPLDGTWSARRGLALWRQCTEVRFQALSLASLSLDARSLRLCPARGGAIVSTGRGGLRVAAGVPSLALTGRLGDTPIRLTSGAVGLAWPGHLAAREVAVELGERADPNRFTIAALDAKLGRETVGTYTGAEARLAAVPLDILNAGGTWRFANGQLALGEGAFRLEDRQLDDRFRPLVARDATLTLIDNRIAAFAALREPRSDRVITEASIVHDLGSGRGHADLPVRDLRFDQQLQPDTLTYLALGVIANAEGTLRGGGRIDWTPDHVTSTGSFTTDKFDFAAEFGPVEGVSGTIAFTDLIGLVTAPDQRLKIASINPGIEVFDGKLSFQLEPDGVLVVNGAEWPFVDGELFLLPTRMKLGAVDERRFTLKVVGADAAQFVQQLDMSNIAAKGVFDGELPLVFDENGGRIENGLLTSRAPGGNVSYIGALTYKDMGSMANFAFQSLRSLDFKRMEIGLGGELDGDIFTQVRIDGVTQGEGAKRNFVTRQVGRLPIRFNINIRAPFQRMLNSFRSLYDPGAVRDPRALGLIDAQGRPIQQPAPPAPLPPDIQPPDSRKVP